MGEKVHVNVRTTPYLVFGEVVLVFFELFFVSLKVFDHQIFPNKFIMIGKMIDDMAIIESHAYFL